MTAATSQQPASQQIVRALEFSSTSHTLLETIDPLPMPELHSLPRDGSMLYGLGRIDASGRVANQSVIGAMNLQPGDSLEVIVAPRAIVIRRTLHGLISVPQRPCIVIPATIRHHRGISAGDLILLAAAPDHGMVIVHTLSDLDEMLAEYHAHNGRTRVD